MGTATPQPGNTTTKSGRENTLMIPKIITPDAYDFGMPTVALIDTYSKGFHMEALYKRAAQFDTDLNNIEKKAGYTYLHLITTGSGEKYGPNNNGDYFNKQACEMTPFLGGGLKKMAGGLLEYHNPTFMEFGKVYKNHQNRHKKGTPSGYIVKAAYNNDMDRGELIVGVENENWSKELQKVAEEKPIFFSMACDVKHDTCSACGNQASKLSEYCDHLRNDMLSISKEGHQVYAINDKPLFHDISGVFKPADKIAFALRKVASDRVLSSAEIASLHGLSPRVDIMRKYAGTKPSKRIDLLMKLAAIEKEILASTSGDPVKDLMIPFSGCKGHGPDEFEDSTVNLMKNQDPGALFGSMKNKMVVMPMETFMKVVTGDGYDKVAPSIDSAKGMLPGVFSRLLEDPNMESLLDDGSYESSGSYGGQELESEISRLVGSHSLAASPVKDRVIKIMVSGSKGPEAEMPKEASEINDAAADFLAKEYARYVISFADGMPEDKLNLTVAQTIANSI
jgi:hypothetical protein